MHFLQLLVYQIKLESPGSQHHNIKQLPGKYQQWSTRCGESLPPTRGRQPHRAMVANPTIIWHDQGGTTDLLVRRLKRHVLGQPSGLRHGLLLPKALLGRECRCCWTSPRQGSWHHRRSQKDHTLLAWARESWGLRQNCNLVAYILYFLDT